MSLLAALSQYLTQVTAVTTAMGPAAADRIRPEAVPQGQRGAFVVYQRLDTTDHKIVHGEIIHLHDSLVQITVWADDPDTRERVAVAVKVAMRQWRGTWDDVEIRTVRKDYDADSTEDASDASEQRDWRTTLRYVIWHRNLQEA